jgi:mRNA-degrading endonuclease YafQ of YafQ-DinJ toxin-antitoxin module
MFEIKTTKYFDKKFKKITSKDNKIRDLALETIIQLSKDPFHPRIRSHKVGDYWSSWVNGEIRIIWIVEKSEIKCLELQNIGTHKEVY